VIITADSKESMVDIHDRLPVTLNPEQACEQMVLVTGRADRGFGMVQGRPHRRQCA